MRVEMEIMKPSRPREPASDCPSSGPAGHSIHPEDDGVRAMSRRVWLAACINAPRELQIGAFCQPLKFQRVAGADLAGVEVVSVF